MPDEREAKSYGIVLLGRGVIKTADGIYLPSPYITDPSLSGLPNSRAGDLMIGGADANVNAAAKLVLQRLQSGALLPAMVSIAAGVPPYLEKLTNDSMAEGDVLSILFNKLIGNINIPQVIHRKNKDTIDDIREPLAVFRDLEIENATFITIREHAARLRVFINFVKALAPELNEVKTQVISTESIMPEYDSDYMQKPDYWIAWERTHRMEQQGIIDLQTGVYRFKNRFVLERLASLGLSLGEFVNDRPEIFEACLVPAA